MAQPGSVGVLVVAYNAETTLRQTLDRLPGSFVPEIDQVLVSDDASSDDTHGEALRFLERGTLPMTVVRQPSNLGYGGNQKFGYDWFGQRSCEVVVLLHGDGQYAPEVIHDLVDPLLRNEADAVFGSRMIVPGAARAGGMPLYKYVGNRILTSVQNRAAGLRLSEWHSGYRAYRMDALADLDLVNYADGFNFDTQIILGLQRAGKRIHEVAIPTFYGEEICYVNGLAYARDVLRDVAAERMNRRRAAGPTSAQPAVVDAAPIGRPVAEQRGA